MKNSGVQQLFKKICESKFDFPKLKKIKFQGKIDFKLKPNPND